MPVLTEYLLFLAKTTTIVIAIVLLLIAILAIKSKAKAEEEGTLHIKKLNEKYDDMTDSIHQIILSKTEKKAQKTKKKTEKKASEIKKKIFVIDFDGDIKASAVSDLRECITAILLTATPNDHVLLCLESAGGIVNGYGLAASQLQRLRDANIHLVVAIDKIAASGGYMMACVANHILAAPFAIIGSIGVIAQLPNFYRLLQKNNIDFEQVMAGQYKRTLTVFGKNTEEGREKLQEEINDTQELFKSFVKTHRTQVIIDEVATGEHWFGAQCIDKKLIDQLQTSDDYLLSKKDECEIYEVEFKIKQSILQRFQLFVQNSFYHVMR